MSLISTQPLSTRLLTNDTARPPLPIITFARRIDSKYLTLPKSPMTPSHARHSPSVDTQDQTQNGQ